MTQTKAALLEILEEFTQEVTPKSLSGGETPLAGRLRDAYELLHAPTTHLLGRYYTRGVLEALFLWCTDPLFFPDPTGLEEYMLSCFACELKHSYTKRAEKLMTDMSLKVYEALQAYFDTAMNKRGLEPVEISFLSMQGFQYYWMLQLARQMTVQAAELYRESRYCDMLVDFNLPFRERCLHRRKQLDGNLDSVRSTLRRDGIRMRLSAFAFACDDKIYTVLKNQLILSLKKWIDQES